VKAKKGQNLVFDLDTINRRLDAITEDPIDVTLDVKWEAVSRSFLSKHYGGSTQPTFPSIGPSFRETHGEIHWMFPNLSYNPCCAAVPGVHGLFFEAEDVEDLASHAARTFRVVVRLDSSVWLYVGEYQLILAPSLTQEEWLLQTVKVCSSAFLSVSPDESGVKYFMNYRSNIPGPEIYFRKVGEDKYAHASRFENVSTGIRPQRR
jgi:hypothetical protein